MGSQASAQNRQMEREYLRSSAQEDHLTIKQSLNLLKARQKKQQGQSSPYGYQAYQAHQQENQEQYGRRQPRQSKQYDRVQSEDKRKYVGSSNSYHHDNDASSGRVSQMRRASKIPQEYAPQIVDKRKYQRYSDGLNYGSDQYMHNSSILNKSQRNQHDSIRKSYNQHNSMSIRHSAARQVEDQRRYQLKKSPLKDTRSSSQDQEILPIGRRKNMNNQQQINLYRKGKMNDTYEEEQEPPSQPAYRKYSRNSDSNYQSKLSSGTYGSSHSHQPNFKKKQISRQPQPIMEQERGLDNNGGEFDVSQYGDNPNLVLCRAGCGRKFLPDRIKKHEQVCKKVNQRKRKQFDAQKHRMVAKDQARLMKKGQVIMDKLDRQKQNQQVPKWKAQSLALRARIKMGQDPNYQPSREQQKMMRQQNNTQMVDCPYCGRHFNEKAASKHIPYCKNQSLKQPRSKR